MLVAVHRAQVHGEDVAQPARIGDGVVRAGTLPAVHVRDDALRSVRVDIAFPEFLEQRFDNRGSCRAVERDGSIRRRRLRVCTRGASEQGGNGEKAVYAMHGRVTLRGE